MSMSHRSVRHPSLLFPHRYILSAARLGLERCLVSAPCAEMTPIYYTSIRQREHKKCCQLIVWTRFTSAVHARRAYIPFLLAVKTSYPQKSVQKYCIFCIYANKKCSLWLKLHFFLFSVAAQRLVSTLLLVRQR